MADDAAEPTPGAQDGLAALDGMDRLLDLSGRAAIVTGAGSGIGRGIARRLAERGARVVVADIDPAGAAVTVKAIAESGGEGVDIVADVRDIAAAAAVSQRALDEFGRLDILVNNAGLYPRSAVLDTTEELWDRVMDINVKGTFLFSQACARVMTAAGQGGAIVNLASKQAIRGGANLAHYAASKAAVALFTQSMAIELGPAGIRVNAIAPGPVRTAGGSRAAVAQVQADGSELTADQLQEDYRARIPLRRFSQPDDIARVVAFLVSDAASLMTGSVVVVDGGAVLT